MKKIFNKTWIASYITPENSMHLRIKEGQGYIVVPIVPNISQYARDMTQGGPINAIVKRFFSLSVIDKAIFLFHIFFHPVDILLTIKKDFAMGIRLLTELELLFARGLIRAPAFAVGSDLIDLALAYENKEIFRRLLDLAKTYNLPVIFYTANYRTLNDFLIHNFDEQDRSRCFVMRSLR